MNENGSKRRLVSRLLWGIVLVIVAGILLLMATRRRSEEVPPPKEKAVPVRVMKLAPRAIPDIVQIPGRLDAWENAILSAEQEGRVTKIPVEQGESVKRGQVVAEVDKRLWKEALRKAEVAVRDAEKDLARWTELKKTGAVSPNEYDDIEIMKERAEIALEEAKVMVSQCEVRSPFDGVINARFLEEGEFANKGAALVQVVDVDRLKLKLNVPERDILRIGFGQLVPLTVPACPGRSFTGEVTFVASVADPKSNTYAVEAHVDNAEGWLKGGMIANVALTRGMREEALSVPLAAIVPQKGEYVVFAVADGRAERRVVQMDAIIGAEAILGAGVRAGDEIVVEGHRALQDGLLLDVRRDAGDTTEQSE